MKSERAIAMIDEYLLEPNNIDKAWVEVLELCKKALLEREKQQAELKEFAERFKSKASIQRDRVTGILCYVIPKYKLECLVKEMTEQ